MPLRSISAKKAAQLAAEGQPPRARLNPKSKKRLAAEAAGTWVAKARKKIKAVGKRAKANATPDRTWAADVKERAAGLCVVCCIPGAHAHHIRTRAAHPELRHDVRNGAYLCPYHHDQAHGDMKRFMAWAAANLPAFAELEAEREASCAACVTGREG